MRKLCLHSRFGMLIDASSHHVSTISKSYVFYKLVSLRLIWCTLFDKIWTLYCNDDLYIYTVHILNHITPIHVWFSQFLSVGELQKQKSRTVELRLSNFLHQTVIDVRNENKKHHSKKKIKKLSNLILISSRKMKHKSGTKNCKTCQNLNKTQALFFQN